MELNIPEFEGPLAQRGIGIIAPFDLALERELWRWAPLEVSLHLARTPFQPVAVSRAMAELVSDRHHLMAATRDILQVEPEVVAYLCSSGSFIRGVAFEKTLCDAICEAGAPTAVTTSGALLEALSELGSTKISVLTPYDEELTRSCTIFSRKPEPRFCVPSISGSVVVSGRSTTAPSPNASSAPIPPNPRPSSSAAPICRPMT